MTGNYHVRFLGVKGAERLLTYPIRKLKVVLQINNYWSVVRKYAEKMSKMRLHKKKR